MYEFQLWPSSLRRRQCLFCGECTDRQNAQCVVLEDVRETGWVVCPKCLATPSEHVAIEHVAILRAHAARLRHDADELEALAGNLPPVPSFDEWKSADAAAEFPFGRCPECGNSNGHLNIGRDHWYVCHAHRVRWLVGSNLFSDWRHEDEAIWEANKRRLAEYREVSGDEAPNVAVAVVPAEVSDVRCPDGDHLLGAEVFWCLTCNAYANDLAVAEASVKQAHD